MKYIIFILMICYSMDFSYAQNCKNDFIENVEQTFKKSKSKFDRITSKTVKENYQLKSECLYELATMHIPVIVGKQAKEKKVNRENLLCHLNVKKMAFYETAILKDSAIMGFVFEFPTSNFDYMFDNQSPYSNLVFIKKLIKIKPSIIFTIYHISDAYWYIKDGELKVLAFEINNSKSTEPKIYNAEEFIQSLSEEQINSFLYFKKVKEVSN